MNVYVLQNINVALLTFFIVLFFLNSKAKIILINKNYINVTIFLILAINIHKFLYIFYQKYRSISMIFFSCNNWSFFGFFL